MSEPLATNDLAIAIPAQRPASPGHTLVFPRRSVGSYFEASPAEKAAIWSLIDVVKGVLDGLLHPAGYDVGFSEGDAATHTFSTPHVHIIPRYASQPDPASPFPPQPLAPPAPYASAPSRARPLATGGEDDPLRQHLWPLFASATDIAIVAAFITETGLDLLEPRIFAALRSGCRVRIVTGDYLAFNQVEALQQLLGWSQLVLGEASDTPEQPRAGELRVRVVETSHPGAERAFHPKTWLFESPSSGVAFVGSSNVSRSALETGIEWNLRVERAIDPMAYASVRGAVDALWETAVDLSAAWIEDYARRVQQAPRALPPGEAEAEPLEPPPAPHEFQKEALAALAEARAQGRRRALVVLATGLGKTWLAAFDVLRWAESTGRWPRVLFLAHRQELLAQAALTFRRVLSSAGRAGHVGWCAGELTQLDAPVVVASVQKACRPDNLAQLASEPFEYVIVDEVHHAEAPSYRRVLDRLEPAFLLGLTATPDRADEGDVLALFDGFVAYRADLGVGIARGRLVPFVYHGVRDDIDYEQIPWRNRRFDPASLAAAAQTQSRMERLWRAWLEHAGTRTLVFCCSIEHARFAARWLAERGVRVAAVFSKAGSDDRSESVAQLARGELDAVCVVDVFNEGVDIPAVDRVVMLRPTESPVIFLQQLGRGLRRHDGKNQLTVIDFVGNHKMFLDRVRRLLSLVSPVSSLRTFLESPGAAELPPGCAIELELEVKDLLRSLLPRGGLEVERVYRELVLARGERPTIGELYRMGYRPSTLRKAHGSWFRFVGGEGQLGDDETRVLERLEGWLEELEAGSMDNCLEVLTLEVLLEQDALSSGLGLDELAARTRAALLRSPELLRALEGSLGSMNPATASSAEWLTFWRDNALSVWTRGHGWFAIEGERLVPRRLTAPEGTDDALARMTRELIDYRLQRYRSGSAANLSSSTFRCILTWNQNNPIIKLPPLDRMPERPNGECDVRLPDGAVWRFRFVKHYCNVARPSGTDRNRLPDLMREWFGPNAGEPGTRFEVEFSRSPDGWWIEPIGNVRSLPARGQLIAYPTLRAAAGARADGRPEGPDAEHVTLPFDARESGLFAVRATGNSMDGGKAPIKDGDWLVMRWARAASLGAVTGRVALVQTPDGHGTFAYQVKRIVQQADRWWLRSDNPEHPSFEATEETTIIAQLVTAISPEALAPPLGAELVQDAIAHAFGLPPDTTIARSGRYAGHLFLLITEPGSFTAPDRVRVVVDDRRPSETAYVLTRTEPDGRWRYSGVARWLDAEGEWTIPDLDFATWRALGKGRDCSRRLGSEAKARANAFLEELFQRVGPEGWIAHNGKRCRVLERTPAGVRIDGGQGGFAARQVSVTDVAWTMLAADDVTARGGVLDEARVNRLRYLDGTPKGSTRWIDTGWAITLFLGGVSSA